MPESPAAPESPGGQRRRFCPRCGAPWQPGWSTCQLCAHSAAPVARVEAAPRGRVGDALWVYFLLLASFAILFFGPATVDGELTVMAIDTLVVLACVVAMRRRLTLGVTTAGRPVWYLVAIAFGCLTFLVATGCVEGLASLLGLQPVRMSAGFLDEGYGWGVVVLASVAQPAIVEELAFRGIILGALRSTLSSREAVVVTALMFMVLHLAVASFPHLLLIGLALGCLRVWSGSLWPCVLMHAVHNGLVIAAEAWRMAG